MRPRRVGWIDFGPHDPGDTVARAAVLQQTGSTPPSAFDAFGGGEERSIAAHRVEESRSYASSTSRSNRYRDGELQANLSSRIPGPGAFP